MEVIKRVKIAINHLIVNNIASNQQEIGFALGYKSKASFSNIISEQVNMPRGFIDKFCNHFPIFSEKWLNTGEGEMLKRKNQSSNAEEIGYPTGEDIIITERSGNEFIDTEAGDSYMGVPLVEYQAYAGYLGGWNDPEYILELPKHWISVDKRYRGLYRAFVVRGDSMNDGTLESIIDGDIVTCRLIEKHLWSSKFHMHQYSNFVIVHKDGIIVKELKDHEVEDGVIKVRSRNPNKETYPDQEISLKDVYEILNVLDINRKMKLK